MDMPNALRAITERRNLSAEDMRAVMRLIMTGQATQAQIGGFLVGLRMKGETVDEITAAVQVMRELVTPVNVSTDTLVDIVGTGGDGAHTFNISTASAFVVAAAGGRVAKHGNRSVSSQSGSADVLEAAGVNINLTPEQVARCVNEVGVGFMFAPLHHSAMKHAIGPRREMGVRTIFNLLGPLTNPAGALNKLIGVYSANWVEPVAQVLAKLGSKHVLVVHSDDGMDEISIAAPTQVAELKNGQISIYSIAPEQLGIPRGDKAKLTVQNAQESIEKIRAVLNNTAGPERDIVVLNSAAALYVAGLTPSLKEGVKLAQHVIASGAAHHKLTALVKLSSSM